MLKKFLFIFSILFISLPIQISFAFSTPVEEVFSDIDSNYKYLHELQTLYDKWMIIPDLDWKFNPKALLNRDEFVWILTEVTCKKCIQPETSFDLINLYENKQIFYDINKENKYFYCIADSLKNSYVSWYSVWSTCNNWSVLEWQKPFCPSNNIVLEEAISIILRASWILTNSEADKVRNDIFLWKITENLSDDVSPKNIDWTVYSFYPDFKKALEYEVFDVDNKWNTKNYKLVDIVDWKIRPKQTISKEMFLKIAYVALKANSCIIKSENKLAIDMLIKDKTCTSSNKNCNLSSLKSKDNTYDFTLKTNTICEKWIKEPEWYIWRFYNYSTWKEIKKYWTYIDNFTFPENWEWKVFVRVVDNCWNTWEVYNTFYWNTWNTWIILDINPSQINWKWPLFVNYNSIISNTNWQYTYYWDFWDWNTAYGKDAKNLYKEEWTYLVTLYVTDKNWLTISSSVLIQVDWLSLDKIDSDWDLVMDNDDLCPLINGSSINKWCPILEETCSVKKWCKDWFYCSDQNICLPKILANSCEYTWWDVIFWNVSCNTCPCNYSLDFISPLRKCDVIFPAITSVDNKNIYSKGEFYQLK